MSEKVKTLMQALEEACGVTGKDIYEEDSKIDYREDLAMSKVEVETKPSEAPTEKPTDTPTSEPTETPTEASHDQSSWLSEAQSLSFLYQAHHRKGRQSRF